VTGQSATSPKNCAPLTSRPICGVRRVPRRQAACALQRSRAWFPINQIFQGAALCACCPMLRPSMSCKERGIVQLVPGCCNSMRSVAWESNPQEMGTLQLWGKSTHLQLARYTRVWCWRARFIRPRSLLMFLPDQSDALIQVQSGDLAAGLKAAEIRCETSQFRGRATGRNAKFMQQARSQPIPPSVTHSRWPSALGWMLTPCPVLLGDEQRIRSCHEVPAHHEPRVVGIVVPRIGWPSAVKQSGSFALSAGQG
jgi:hypothetical protein